MRPVRFPVAWVCLAILLWLSPCFAGSYTLYDVSQVTYPASVEPYTRFNQSINLSGQYNNLTVEFFAANNCIGVPTYEMAFTDSAGNPLTDCMINYTCSFTPARKNVTFPLSCVLDGDGSYGQFRLKYVASYGGRIWGNLDFYVNTANPFAGGHFVNPYAPPHGYGNTSDAVFRIWAYEYAPPETPTSCDQYLTENMTGPTRVGGNFALFLCKVTEPSVGFVLTILISVFICMLLFAVSILLVRFIRQAH